MILSKDQNEICQWLLFDMSQGILGFFSDFFPNNIRRFWNPCLWGVAMWCWPVSRYSKISDSCTIPMNMSLASEALRLLIFWYAVEFSPKIQKKMLPSCSSYYIFFFVFLSYFWFMIFFDVMVTSRNVLLYFLPFFVAFWFYSAHEQMFTSLILEMSLVSE